MTKEILTSENLIEIHENLNDFAKHHQNLGRQKVHKVIKAMWDETKSQPRDVSDDSRLRDEGFDRAFSIILKEICYQSIP